MFTLFQDKNGIKTVNASCINEFFYLVPIDNLHSILKN